ncbi:hypothetical protein [Aestuariirhabdus litorea]|uniref:Uncharacterized protein n=1 Tax=Aestuariirhabdus litorea TaxID=2528527 RepID=A0A3P3VQH6_9GAMM|nr:hypothetical protein [Aestuariirhabdus litorea]RRJ85042.1 hypothetical protein D0544_08180 [Aestuariirhabdus litorea]RWW98267.1 hypothetical protein DZC74_08175 [Endozoicomonadaceae bacterium GTF-13]
MSPRPSPSAEDDSLSQPAPFKPWKIIVGVLLALLAVNLWFRLYTEEVSLPRYCDTREQTLMYLEKVITDPRPAGEESRRPYLIAAKLLYLYPRGGDEVLEDYLARVDELIETHCR